jgi:hypothetical protein
MNGSKQRPRRGDNGDGQQKYLRAILASANSEKIYLEEREVGMSNRDTGEKRFEKPGTSALLVEAQVQQPHLDCPVYTWDREAGCLRVTGFHRAKRGLPADLATLQLEGELNVPLLLPTACSFAPDTRLQVRLLGALGNTTAKEPVEQALPVDDLVFVAVAEADPSFTACTSLTQLPSGLLEAMKKYVESSLQEDLQQGAGSISCVEAAEAARLLRETRVALKRRQRARSKERGWLKREREEEEKPVAWRAVEGLSEALRLQLLRERGLQADENAPHAQAERLIRFVPQRFQEALSDLLLDDERLLAFVERPLLRHRSGWLGLQSWRSNEGLFLLTDRQVLWLRDFMTPGSNFLSGGYIAHSAPLERLQSITVLPPGSTPREWIERLETKDSPYLRLVLEVGSATGSEPFVVEFPHEAEAEKALARLHPMLQAFLPAQDDAHDRRLRRLPEVEVWMPQGTEADRLAGLGGHVRPEIAERLEQQLSKVLASRGEERLISTLVPALEDFKSPARLVALTRSALVVLDEPGGKSSLAMGAEGQVQCYGLTSISSAQLRYSLLGSSLSLFLPKHDGTVQRVSIPFHSPAIAWFVPLFTRLRLLLSGPYRVLNPSTV